MSGYAMAQTSLAHTYGNITSFIVEYIKGMFPENYFKTIHVSSMVAFREFSIFQNTNKEFIHKDKPMLIIRPRIEMDDGDTFLYNTFLTTRMSDNYMETCFTNLQEFMYDNERGNTMKFLLNRLVLNFDVTIITETQIEQINQAHFFKNRVRQNIPFFLHTSLESHIPRELMRLMSEDIDIPMYDENGSISTFLEYVNGISKFPISYKIKNATGNDEFFRFYPVNIDTLISGLSIDDGNKRGVVSDMFTVSFSIRTEFNGAGLYYYFARKPDFINQFVGDLEEGKSHTLIPLFTISNLHTERIDIGWNLYTAPIFKVDPNASEDVTELTPLFNNSMLRIINYHKENNISPDIFIKIIIMKDNTRLIPNEGYIVDFDKLQLITKDCDPEATYRLIIHVNTLYINEMLDRLLSLSEEK